MSQAVPVERSEWPGNEKGGRLKTLPTIAKKIREARTLEMKKFGHHVLEQGGYAAGTQPTNAQIAAVFRDWIREHVRYRPDPVMTEWIQSADITLCVPGTRGEKFCIPVEDCDGHIVVMGGWLAAMGIDVHVLAIHYGQGIQPHVIIEFQEEDGRWTTCDTTPPWPPIGYRPEGHYTVIDPFDPKDVPTDMPGGEFVGVGAANAPTAIAYQSVTLPGTAHQGLRYRVGMQLTYGYDPTDNYRATQETWYYFASQGWVIESLEAQGPAQNVPGLEQYIQAFILQGIATKEIALSGDSFVQYLVAGVQAQSATPGSPSAPLAQPAPVAPSPEVSMGKALVVAAGAGLAVGLGLYAYRRWRGADVRPLLAAGERRRGPRSRRRR